LQEVLKKFIITVEKKTTHILKCKAENKSLLLIKLRHGSIHKTTVNKLKKRNTPGSGYFILKILWKNPSKLYRSIF